MQGARFCDKSEAKTLERPLLGDTSGAGDKLRQIAGNPKPSLRACRNKLDSPSEIKARYSPWIPVNAPDQKTPLWE